VERRPALELFASAARKCALCGVLPPPLWLRLLGAQTASMMRHEPWLWRIRAGRQPEQGAPLVGLSGRSSLVRLWHALALGGVILAQLDGWPVATLNLSAQRPY